ncbi:MAG TPA: ferritin-like domain-containing protein [Nannocystis sp.]|jgi:hypothetical protein
MTPRPLAPLFAALLASLTQPGCPGECVFYDVYEFELPADALASYLADDTLTMEECEEACRIPHLPQMTGEATSSSSGSSEPTTGGTTSGGASGTGGTDGTDGSSGGSDTSSYMDTEFHDWGPLVKCSTRTVDATTVALTCKYRDPLTACGRCPIGTVHGRREPVADPTLAWLLAAAELEAISVPAFTELAADLARHGAPDELRQAALDAADDERRHTAAIVALARRRGGAPVPPSVDPAPAADLETLASHNAVEGCVRETWGALVAAFQARNAAEPDVRAAQARIAEDERTHAELAWRIDAWVRPRLSPSARARVDAARSAAVRILLAAVEQLGIGQADVGLPNSSQARALVRGLQTALW